jgi:hypothetical protein
VAWVLLLHENEGQDKHVESDTFFGLEIRERCIRVYSIEHVEDDIFNVISDKGVFTINQFKPCLIH